MLVVSSREFRAKQKMYLDLVDKNEQVIVHRGKDKAYMLEPITEAERFFSDLKVKARIEHSLAQAKKEQITTISKDDIDQALGL